MNTGVETENPLARQIDRFDLAIVVLVILSYLIVSQLPFAPKKYGDEVFFEEAKAISQVLHGAKDWREITITRAPGPVLFYAIPYSLMPADSPDHSYWIAGLIWTMIIIGLVTLLIRRASALIGTEASGRLAAVLVLLTPFSVYYSYGVSAEPMAYVGSAIACYGYATWRISESESKLRGVLLTILGLVFLVLARPNSILLFGVGVIVAGILTIRPSNRRTAAFTTFAVFVSAVITVGCLILVSSISGGGQRDNLSHVLFHGRFQYRTEPWDWRYWDNETRVGSVDYQLFAREESGLKARSITDNIPLLQLKREWAIEDFMSHPEITVQQAGIRMLTMHLLLVNSKSADAFSIAFVPGIVVYVLFHIAVNVVYFLILLGSTCFVYTNRFRIFLYWIFWAVHVSLLAFHGLTYGEPRYLFPSLPGLTIMASVGLLSMAQRMKIISSFGRLRQRKMALNA